MQTRPHPLPTASLIASLTGAVLATLTACGGGNSSFINSGKHTESTPTCQSEPPADTKAADGYSLASVADGLSGYFAPIDIAFIPGSKAGFVVASKDGAMKYFNGDCTAVNEVFPLSLGSDSGEQGLLNIEFHPDFATNHFMFAYFTSTADTVNSVSRMTVSFDGNGNLTVSDVVRIIDFRKADYSVASNHNGGGLVFAPDGSLLASVGDGGDSSTTAQDDDRLLGKIVRILPSLAAGAGGYTIPGGNMFPATNGLCSGITLSATACPEILAKGLRNPFRMSIDGNVIYVGDVGNDYEEINSLDYTRSTVNFGWPTHDGPTSASALTGYRDPILAYRRGIEGASFRAEDPMAQYTGMASVMIGDIYHGSNYDGLLGGNLLFGDFYDGYNRAVSVGTGSDGNGIIQDGDSVPGTHLFHANSISSYAEGPDGFIYFTRLLPAGVYRLVRP